MKRQMLSISLAVISTLSALPFAAFPSLAIEKELEVMTDRCSGEVIIVPNYNAPLDAPGGLFLKRDQSGNTPLTEYIRVDGRQIRWYCHSKADFKNLDPGTWRLKEIGIGAGCTELPGGTIACKPSGSLKLGSSAKDGWFAERSRCPSGTTHIRARLGSNRLLRIACAK